jgi:dTDP-4-dehydrorhamnose 3,5-epimerase
MVKSTQLSISGAWVFQSPVYCDSRGHFRESFKEAEIREQLKREFNVTHASFSNSKKGVIRGIHFNRASKGQAKWISCTSGKLWDVVVDIRPNSPTFRKWEAVELSADDGKSLFISEGLGHAFLALEDETVTAYLFTAQYSPADEIVIYPLDKDLAIQWPNIPMIISERDASAPTLDEFLKSL